MKILTRYILKECTSYFLVTLLAFTGILFTIRLLKFASLVVNKGLELSQLGWIFLAIVPTFLEIAIPLASLLGVMLAFARLSGDSELVVLRGSGVSIGQLILPVAIFGLLTGLLTLLVSLELKPWGFRTLNQTLFEIARTKTTSGLSEGVFNDLGKLTLYANTIDQYSGNLQRVFIDDRREESARKIVVAESGNLASDTARRTITLNLDRGTAHEVQGGSYTLTNFDTNRIVMDATDLLPNGQQQKDRSPRELTVPEIRDQIDQLREQRATLKLIQRTGTGENEEAERLLREAFGQLSPDKKPPSLEQVRRRLTRLKVEHGMRYSMAAAALVLALIGMPLGVQPARSQQTWGATISVLLGLAVFLLYYGALTIGWALADGYVLDPYVSAWLPNLLCLGIASYALTMIGTERWHSIAEGFHWPVKLMSRLIAKFKGRTVPA